MASIFDRLLGRTEPQAVPEPPAVKAVTGPGAYALTYLPPLHSLNADPNRLMAEAMALYHQNPWVGAAERALGSRFIRLDWHLENDAGDTITDKSPERERSVLRLLERPSQRKLRSQLWGLTFRHCGLAGNAVWYLDQREGVAGTPLELLYINPARLTPSTNGAGDVVGWLLDGPNNPVSGRQGFPGVPLSTEEIIHFTFEEPDWGVWGVGIPESAQRKIELDRLADVHAGGVLGSGGRLSGLITPKTGESMNDDQWTQFARDWRRIADDPNAAKRLQIAKVPLDFQQTVASPKDLQLVDVSNGSRDDILAIWGVPKSQLGMNVPSGLNADRSEADDAAIWETVKGRAEGIREKIQYELLDRFAALGVNLQLVFDYPEFDDETPLFDRAATSRYLALTNDERRAVAGFDPLEDEQIGKAIFIASDLVRLDEEQEPTPEPVNPLTPPVVSETTTDEEEEVVEEAVKADLRKPLLGLRAQTEATWEPKIRKAIATGLAAQRKYVEGKLEHAIAKRDVGWWSVSKENARLLEILEPLVEQLAGEVAQSVRQPLGKADLTMPKIIAFVRSRVGERIAGINATTRDKLKRLVETAVTDGLSPAALAERLDGAFGESRAELISRTETMLAYNDAALNTYQQLGSEEVEAIDGDDDPECAARNGLRLPISQALGISDHPNGTLDWIPVVKAAPDPLLLMAEAMQSNTEVIKASMNRPIQVDVHQAPITVNSPDIYPTFTAPEVNVTVPPAKAKRIVRDEQGAIIGLEEN